MSLFNPPAIQPWKRNADGSVTCNGLAIDTTGGIAAAGWFIDFEGFFSLANGVLTGSSPSSIACSGDMNFTGAVHVYGSPLSLEAGATLTAGSGGELTVDASGNILVSGSSTITGELHDKNLATLEITTLEASYSFVDGILRNTV